MSLDAFAAAGTFWKGNLHTHSTRSDGTLSPDEVCAAYRERGYDFLCVSDHFLPKYGFPITDTSAFGTDVFTTIPGAEVHAPALRSGEIWHILAVGLPVDFAPAGEHETGPALAERCLAAGAFVALPHPEWYGLTEGDAATIPGAHAVEIYNHTSAVHNARGGGSYFLDALLTSGRRINALSCDDAHFNIPGAPFRDAFGGWVMVKAGENSPASLLAALKAGHYYATQGPDIFSVELVDEVIRIDCSEADQIMLLGQGSRNELASGSGLVTAELPVARFDGSWGRLVVMDSGGRCAWSNPIWF